MPDNTAVAGGHFAYFRAALGMHQSDRDLHGNASGVPLDLAVVSRRTEIGTCLPARDALDPARFSFAADRACRSVRPAAAALPESQQMACGRGGRPSFP